MLGYSARGMLACHHMAVRAARCPPVLGGAFCVLGVVYFLVSRPSLSFWAGRHPHCRRLGSSRTWAAILLSGARTTTSPVRLHVEGDVGRGLSCGGDPCGGRVSPGLQGRRPTYAKDGRRVSNAGVGLAFRRRG
jgi:hypothetical protein